MGGVAHRGRGRKEASEGRRWAALDAYLPRGQWEEAGVVEHDDAQRRYVFEHKETGRRLTLRLYEENGSLMAQVDDLRQPCRITSVPEFVSTFTVKPEAFRLAVGVFAKDYAHLQRVSDTTTAGRVLRETGVLNRASLDLGIRRHAQACGLAVTDEEAARRVTAYRNWVINLHNAEEEAAGTSADWEADPALRQ